MIVPMHSASTWSDNNGLRPTIVHAVELNTEGYPVKVLVEYDKYRRSDLGGPTHRLALEWLPIGKIYPETGA